MPAKKASIFSSDVLEVDGVDRRIAEVADPRQAVRRDIGDVMDLPHQARLVADFAGTVAGAGAVGGAAVEGNADEGDIDLGWRDDRRQAHEGRQAGEARHLRRVDRLREGAVGGHSPNSLRIAAEISATWSAISHSPFSADEPCATASTPEAGTKFSGTGRMS